MTITPILIGGLGNRLYQLANALRLQEIFNCNLKIFRINPKSKDVSDYRHLVLRASDFDDFGGHNILKKDGLPTTFSELFPTLNISDGLHNVDNILKDKKLFFENTINFIIPGKDTVVMGYFFSYKFVSSQIETIRNLLNPMVEEYVDITYPTLLSEKVLGIHLRLGIGTDNTPAINDPLTFYNNILNLEENNFDSILIVSDNPEKAKNFIGGLNIDSSKFKIIKDEPMFVDMLILSKCSTLIIAPSTLSAWSAYLNKHKNIYVPEIWVRHHWTNDIPKEWKIL